MIANSPKNPVLALVLSLVLPGAGQIYNGETGKGVAMIVGSVVCLAASALVLPIFIVLGLWIWGMIDANARANELNASAERIASDEVSSRTRKDLEQKDLERRQIQPSYFVSQMEKFAKLRDANMLTDEEFTSRKAALIAELQSKDIVAEAEDFLAALIPLVQRKTISETELLKIKSCVL